MATKRKKTEPINVRVGPKQEPTPAEAPKQTYEVQVMTQTIPLGDPGEAEKVRQFLAPHEGDAVVFVEGKWLFTRRRAFLKEQTDAKLLPADVPGAETHAPATPTPADVN